jgi:methyltransferase (TIGR00027 family)
MRQFGRLLPPDVRLADDPYGAAFYSARIAKVIERLPRLATLSVMRRGIVYMQVRTRVIDDQLRAFVAAGGRQLVVLGAGYDCRALRLPELQDALVLEVDHPATQAHKKRTLAELGAHSPARYLEWNFEQRSLDELPAALAGAGLDRSAPVFTIWEGVTMYLSEAAIDASLRAIRAYSPPDSRLALTYFEKDVLARPSVRAAVVARLGEPWQFGWAPSALGPYLAERGFRLVRDIDLVDAARELLPSVLARHLSQRGRHEAVAVAA